MRTFPQPPANGPANAYPPPYYGPPTYYGPAGGYLAGGANVIGSQGQMMVDQQQAFLMQQQVRQAKIQTRHDQLNETLYERAVTPTTVDNQQRYLTEQLRWARNDPPATAIWSGGALNDLLIGIQRQQAQGIHRPDVPLNPSVLQHINVTGGQTNSSLALLGDTGELRWPIALQTDTFTPDRQTIDKLAQEAYKQAKYSNVQGDTVQKMTDAVNTLQTDLRQQVSDMDPNQYIQGCRYVNELNSLLNALQGPDVANYFNGKWVAQGRSVGQLVQEMTTKGLRFAPALPADEAAYTALQRAMAAYYMGPDPQRPWDPLEK
jgi:hypothetical protein